MEPQFQYDALTIVLAGLIPFVVGFVWYTKALFGKVWARELGFAEDHQPQGKELVRGIVLNVVGGYLMGFVFYITSQAFVEATWFHDDPSAATLDVPLALTGAFYVWLGFILPLMLGIVAWEGKSWRLAAINGGYHFVSLALMAVVFALLA